jgi:hypothetical protein
MVVLVAGPVLEIAVASLIAPRRRPVLFATRFAEGAALAPRPLWAGPLWAPPLWAPVFSRAAVTGTAAEVTVGKIAIGKIAAGVTLPLPSLTLSVGPWTAIASPIRALAEAAPAIPPAGTAAAPPAVTSFGAAAGPVAVWRFHSTAYRADRGDLRRVFPRALWHAAGRRRYAG